MSAHIPAHVSMYMSAGMPAYAYAHVYTRFFTKRGSLDPAPPVQPALHLCPSTSTPLHQAPQTMPEIPEAACELEAIAPPAQVPQTHQGLNWTSGFSYEVHKEDLACTCTAEHSGDIMPIGIVPSFCEHCAAGQDENFDFKRFDQDHLPTVPPVLKGTMVRDRESGVSTGDLHR